MHTDDEIFEHQAEELERKQRFAQPYVDRAIKAYSQSLNGLWIGNAGAAITILGFISGVAKDRPDIAQQLLTPLSLFVFGLIAMGIGAAISLVQQGRIAHHMEDISSIFEIDLTCVKRSSEYEGLSLRDARTVTGCIGALLFVAGCIVSLWMLWNSG